MQYRISGKQIDMGAGLKADVEQELGSVVDKYAERPTGAQVIFSRSGREYECEIVVHLSTGLTAQARGHASGVRPAFDQCRGKMEKQLRRYKRRLKNHHHERTSPVEHSRASSYILAAQDDSGDQEPDTLQPMIIAEMESEIPTLSAGEAVMQMELAASPVLVFRNEKHGGVNVVYRRDDGNFGWVDPQD